MSIFSRLFNKGSDADGEQESSAEGKEGEVADAKKSMRPEAPSFQINPPPDDASMSGVAATPVMQIGAGDKRIARSSRPPRQGNVADPSRASQPSAQRAAPQNAQRASQGAKARPGASTMVMGSNFTAGSGATFPPAPAPYAAPPGHEGSKAPSWSAQRPAPP